MTMKNGFTTINRLLGKHKESSSNLSRSSTNLSVTKSTVNINESSQVHQNRITPLPIATSNAPFEQTFRITVLLPRDQLYVARLGAKVLLHKLLQLVCENKQLDPDKYEFQHPADPSQIFSNDLTIGAVGLSEIRLCNKSENNDGTSRRNSFSSSKFSRNSKTISNTPSLYSSRNSLNSMSSSGIDSNFRQFPSDIGTPKHLAPVIPARKKRLAPRPPSQNLTIENEVALRTKASSELSLNTDKAEPQHRSLNTEQNLDRTSEQKISKSNELNKSTLSIDCNGNTKGSLQKNGHCIAQCQETSSETVTTSIELVSSETFNSHTSIENISTLNQPEPSPRRKVQTLPKKTVPVAPPRSTKPPTEKINDTQTDEKASNDISTLKVVPIALPRSSSSSSLISEHTEQINVNSKNVSEIVVNQSPTPEANFLLQPPDGRSTPVESGNSQSKGSVVFDDGEELVDRSWNSLSTQSSERKQKSFVESSSEDDEMVKVYDLKLGKTIVKSLSNHKTSEVLDGVLPNNKTEQKNQPTSHPIQELVHSSSLSDVDQKPAAVTKVIKPVSPELHSSSLEHNEVVSPVEIEESFVSSSKMENQNNIIIEDKLSQQIEDQQKSKDVDIICENNPNQSLVEKSETGETNNVKVNSEEHTHKTLLINAEEKQQLLVETKHSIEDIVENQMPKTTNDRITTSIQATGKQEPLISTLERLVGDEDILEQDEHNFKTPSIQIKPAIQTKPAIPTKSALAARSSSFLSLAQIESNNQRNYTTTDEYFSRRRRSSSELSIGESPSLQSLGVIKSILNSRKNSLNGNEESNRSPPTECDIQSMEEPSPKSNNILKRNKLNQTGETEKIYRYSGPPNIHFSTWSDRPKVQVLIKNEQDCVVDGSKGCNSSVQNTTSTVNRGDLALQRNNQKFSSSPMAMDNGKETLKETNSNYSIVKELTKPQTTPTSITPKFILGARTSNQWPVASATSNKLTHNNRPLSQPPLYRSTSITRIISEPPVIKQTQPAFGQGTLRKTGFKEKIVPLQDVDTNTAVDIDIPKSTPFALKSQINPQTTPKITKSNISIRTEAPPPVSIVPEAPPPPIIRAVVTKQKSSNRTQISLNTVDPRDQLLSAIRNFKRDELKNANI